MDRRTDQRPLRGRFPLARAAALLLVGYTVAAGAARPTGDEDDLIVIAIPSVTLTAPAPNTYYVAGSSIALSADVRLAGGAIASVDFYQSSTLIAHSGSSSSPYTGTWSNVPYGQYSLSAVAISSLGFTGTSAPVSVSVCGAPTVTLTAPAPNTIVDEGTSFDLQASPVSPGGACGFSKVEFYVQGNPQPIGVSLGDPPYHYNWQSLVAGTYTLTARAYDKAGQTADSAGVVFIVNAKPIVSLTSPANNATYNKNATVSLSATASDPDGSIIKVEFFTGSTSLGVGTLSNGQYVGTWNPAPGTYSVFARATDNRSSTKDSTAANITVCYPSVAFTSPTPNQVVNGSTVTLTATASTPAACGTITKVEFYNGATLLATVTAAPYTYNWTNVAPGPYTATAIAYDSRTPVQTVQTSVPFTMNAPPTATLSTAVSGTTYNAPATVTIYAPGSIVLSATGADSDGSISKVEFYDGGTLLCRITSAPYSCLWDNIAVGTHSVTALAYDNRGATGTSGVLTLSALAAPSSATPNPDPVIPGSYPTPAIGTTAGTFGVSDSGAAAYTVPIQVPPGTAGLQPSLALAYSSQGGNGLLGVGWSLSGLSVITRCPQTIAQDGVKLPINYDTDLSNDKYCLDGQRLVRIGGPVALTDNTYGTNTAANKYEYRTESETYTKIESYEEQTPAALFGPYRFRVWTKSGQILDFGSRWWITTAGYTQSPIYNGIPQPRPNVAKVWVLDRVIDRSANFMEIDYADRAYTNGPGDPQYQMNVLHIQQNCSQGRFTPSTPLPTPIGALPDVEYWPTAIRYFAQDALASECGSSANNQVIFAYEDVPSQVAPPFPQYRDRYYDPGAGQTSLSKRLVRIDTRSDGSGPYNGVDGYGTLGTLVKSYVLTYVQSAQTQRSLLASLQEKAGDGTLLPVTQFDWAQKDWNNTGHSFAVTNVSVPFTIGSTKQAWVGDWDGDGKSDIFGWVNGGMTVCRATGSGFNCGAITGMVGFGNNSDNFELMDVNNDGRVDLVYQNGSSYAVCLSNGDFTCTTASGSWTTLTPNGPTLRGDFDGDGRIDVLTYLGNGVYQTCLMRALGFECYVQNVGNVGTTVNGTFYPGYPYSSCGTYPNETTGCENFTGNLVQYQVMIVDANGDGKADLVRRRTDTTNTDPNSDPWVNQWKTCFADYRPNQFQWICHDRFVKGPPSVVSNTTVFDFNGDGLADLAYSAQGSNIWNVCLSTGDGAFEFSDWNIHWDSTQHAWVDGTGAEIDYYSTPRCRTWNGTGASDNTKAIYGDFNGDGRTDIAGSANGVWTVCLSTGSNFSCSAWSGPYISNGNPDLNQWVVTGDFNGDGKTDILCLNSSCANQLALSSGPQTGDVLVKVTTGLGAVTQVTYAPLTDATVYSKGSGADSSSNELDIQSPLYVVKNVQADNGVGGFFNTDYFYENLRGRTDGRGLYGFAKKRERDGNGIVTEVEYNRVAAASYAANWPIVGRPSIVRKYAPTPASYVADISNVGAFNGGTSLFGGNLKLVNRATNTWAARNSSSCGFALCSGAPTVMEGLLTNTLQESLELDGTALPSTATTIPLANIDAYGNPQQLTVASSDGYSKSTANQYSSEVVNYWVLGRLTQSVVTLTKPGVAAVTRKSTFTYHGVNGNCAPSSPSPQAIGYLCQEIIEPDYANDSNTSYSLWQETDYVYDKYGNKTSGTVQFKQRDGTLTTRTTSTTFGYNGRFATSVTNALNQSETRQFDTRFGTMTRQQGPNGIATVGLYDGFGRKYGEQVFDANNAKVAETYTPLEASGLQSGEKYRTRVQVSGGSETQRYFDALQREVRTATKAFATNTYATATTTYDALGRKKQITKPAGGGTVTTTYGTVGQLDGYDALNRPTAETMTGTGLSLATQYTYGAFPSTAFPGITVDGSSVGGGAVVKVTQSGTSLTSRDTTKYTNSQGQTVRVVDGESGATDFSFDAYGNLAKSIGPTGITELMSYDQRGRKTSLTNPDSGSWNYQYNGAGELVRQIDANSQVTLLFYDPLGRTIERREHPGSDSYTVPFVTVWSYDAYADGSTCSRGIGKLCETRTATLTRSGVGGALANPETRSYTVYDVAGRATESVTEVDAQSFESFTTFDANGRVDQVLYPSGYTLQNRYTSWSGALDRVSDPATGTVHWLASARYADGQIQTMTVANQTTTKGYDGFGRVNSIATGSLQSAAYSFDALGNLSSRQDSAAGQNYQSFAYDRVNRLTNDGTGSVSFDAAGNIGNKGGTYTYNPGTHRLSSGGGNSYSGYDANGNVGTITNGSGTRTLAYTPFNLPVSITGSGGYGSTSYLYDGSHARIREVSSGAAASGTTYYVGGFEAHRRTDGVLELRHYLATPEGVVGIYTARSNGLNDLRYWHKDHLGSIVVIADGAGSVKQGFLYDAWGNRTVRSLAGGEPYAEERSYTGHELLTEIGLVHMNGRIYDPVAARFLQADPIVQDPFNGQSYNRYGYVLNNPLSFTDPTGFSWWTQWRRPIFAIGAGAFAWWAAPYVGAYFGGLEAGAVAASTGATEQAIGAAYAVGYSAGQAATIVAGGFAAGGIQGGNIESALQGALFAGLNFGIGEITGHVPAFGTGAFAANVGLHAAVGCGQQAAAGGSCRAGALSGGFSAFAGPFVQGPMPVQFAVHIAIGGFASKLGGDKFENGAITAAFAYLFNACATDVCREFLQRRGFADTSGSDGQSGVIYTDDVKLAPTPALPRERWTGSIGEWHDVDIGEVLEVVAPIKFPFTLSAGFAFEEGYREYQYARAITIYQTTYTQDDSVTRTIGTVRDGFVWGRSPFDLDPIHRLVTRTCFALPGNCY